MPHLVASPPAGDLFAAAEGDTFTHHGEPAVIGPKCATDFGRWYCTTHECGFVNNIAKDDHVGEGTHVMAWVCLEHGPEVP